jgi:hypothetical protein
MRLDLDFQAYAVSKLSDFDDRLVLHLQRLNVTEDRSREVFNTQNNKLLASNNSKFSEVGVIGGCFVIYKSLLRALHEERLHDFIELLTLLASSLASLEAIIDRKNAKSNLMSACAKIGWEKSDHYVAKMKIEEEFLKVKDKFKLYGYGAQFSREMLQKYPIFQSQKTIDKYIKEFKDKYL